VHIIIFFTFTQQRLAGRTEFYSLHFGNTCPLYAILKQHNQTMGTWNTSINGNDSFLDIYQNFFDLYNQGQNPGDISRQLQDDFEDTFSDYEDKNNSLFALALAQWETKSLDPSILKKVKEIIESGNDFNLWKELEADEKAIKRRGTVLENFLKKISTERDKPKRRVR
jgi:hypothetical protein